MKGESVLVEQEAEKEQGEEEGCVATTTMQEVSNFCSLETGEQSHVAPEELNTTPSAPEENMAQDEPLLGDLNLHL